MLDASPDRALLGRRAEFAELRELIDERVTPILIVSDPLSGTSALLHAVLRAQIGFRSTLAIDARECAAPADLGLKLADAAVGQFFPEALSWWQGAASPSSREALLLNRQLRDDGVRHETLRAGEGPPEALLATAVDLVKALAPGSALVVFDHLGSMLSALSAPTRRAILGELRAATQRASQVALVLTDYEGGPIGSALADEQHPMFRAGIGVRIRRSLPEHFTSSDELDPQAPDTSLIRISADLAAGVPHWVWECVRLAPPSGSPRERAVGGWIALGEVHQADATRRWELVRRVHPSAGPVASALALGVPPYRIDANNKTVSDALRRLRDCGLTWRGARSQWAIADPLLAAWLRDRPAPTTMRLKRGTID